MRIIQHKTAQQEIWVKFALKCLGAFYSDCLAVSKNRGHLPPRLANSAA